MAAWLPRETAVVSRTRKSRSKPASVDICSRFVLPASAQERDQIPFKAIPPVIGIESRDNRREPPDCGSKETDGCGLRDPMEKTGHQFRLLEPPLGDPREKAFHSGKGGREVRPFADLVDPRAETEEPENGIIEIIGSGCRRIPCWPLQRVLDHRAPDRREALRRLRGSHADGEPFPEKAFDPLVRWAGHDRGSAAIACDGLRWQSGWGLFRPQRHRPRHQTRPDDLRSAAAVDC